MTERAMSQTVFGDGGLDLDERYWTAQLAGDVPMVGVPPDYERRAAVTRASEVVERAVDAATTAKVVRASAGSPALMFVLAVAALQVCLHKYSGAEDILVGTEPRRQIGDDELVGWLPLRSRVDGSVRVRELLSDVKRTLGDAFLHQRYLSAKPSWASSLPFGVVVVFREGRAGSPVAGMPQEACLVRITYSNELLVACEYSPQRHRRDTIERFLGHYLSALRAVVVQSRATVAELNLLDERQRRELLNRGTGPRLDVEHDPLVHEAIAQQAARRPDAVAICCEGAHLSYAVLETRATRFASHLQRRGVGPEVRVGLCLDRSLDLVIAMLGTLKAGGSYVPLDPDWPAARMEQLVTSAGVALLVGAEDHETTSVQIVSSVSAVCDVPDDDGPMRTGDLVPENGAYVLYTSGSTGAPKGVVVSHRALRNHMAWLVGEFGVGEADRVFYKTAPTFDASVWELYAPLMAGGAMVIAKPGYQRDASYLIETAQLEAVSIIQVVPSLLALLLDDGRVETCGALRAIFCGGEALSTELRAQCAAQTHAELVNLYGPTEATVDSSFWRCPRELTDAVTSIGRPIANADLYVLDARLQLVPSGCAGELCIGGAGLATAYLSRPEATAERFVPNPFSDEGGARLYRTGDLGRQRADGTFEYIGRADRQLKINGHRIEPGEIEAVLGRHEDVRVAVVVPRKNRLGQRVLAAYVEPRPGRVPDTAALAAYARRQLPAHLVPGVFAVVPSFALTSSGKIDRRALPDPWPAPRTTAASPLAASHLERSLAEIWRDILSREQIGVHDNFFDLGGNSLLLALVQARIRPLRYVPIVELFKYPTISSLAKYMTEDHTTDASR